MEEEKEEEEDDDDDDDVCGGLSTINVQKLKRTAGRPT
jgi:hypothetical protein